MDGPSQQEGPHVGKQCEPSGQRRQRGLMRGMIRAAQRYLLRLL